MCTPIGSWACTFIGRSRSQEVSSHGVYNA
jgi:hypothetical protein